MNVLVSTTHDAIAEGGAKLQQQQNPSSKKVVAVDSSDDGAGSEALDGAPSPLDDSISIKGGINPTKTTFTSSSMMNEKKKNAVVPSTITLDNPFKDELLSPLRTSLASTKEKKKSSWSKSMSSSFSSLRKLRFGSNNSLLNGSSNDLGCSSTKNATWGNASSSNIKNNNNNGSSKSFASLRRLRLGGSSSNHLNNSQLNSSSTSGKKNANWDNSNNSPKNSSSTSNNKMIDERIAILRARQQRNIDAAQRGAAAHVGGIVLSPTFNCNQLLLAENKNMLVATRDILNLTSTNNTTKDAIELPPRASLLSSVMAPPPPSNGGELHSKEPKEKYEEKKEEVKGEEEQQQPPSQGVQGNDNWGSGNLEELISNSNKKKKSNNSPTTTTAKKSMSVDSMLFKTSTSHRNSSMTMMKNSTWSRSSLFAPSTGKSVEDVIQVWKERMAKITRNAPSNSNGNGFSSDDSFRNKSVEEVIQEWKARMTNIAKNNESRLSNSLSAISDVRDMCVRDDESGWGDADLESLVDLSLKRSSSFDNLSSSEDEDEDGSLGSINSLSEVEEGGQHQDEVHIQEQVVA